MGRRTTVKTYIAMTGSLLRELRNQKELALSERTLILQRLASTYKNLKDLARDSEELVRIEKQIAELKKDLDSSKKTGPTGIVQERAENG